MPLGLRSSLRWLAAVFMLLGALGGCDSSGVGRLVPVQGAVLVDGQPLATGSLVFKPNAEKGNSSKFEPAATINADGSYQLFTAERAGAPLGWYKVSVVAQAAPDEKNPYAPPKHLVHSRYGDPNSSGLEVEVVESPAAAAYDLKLTK